MLQFGMEYRYTSSTTVFFGDKRDDNGLRDKNACLCPRRTNCDLLVGLFKQNKIYSKNSNFSVSDIFLTPKKNVQYYHGLLPFLR